MRPAAVLALFALALVLAGCGTASDGSSFTPPSRASEIAECERSGGVWFSGPAACVRGGGAGGGM